MESNSSKIKEAWAIADKRQFCKQSCTKISQGLDKLDSRSSERAIWELFQNARDLAMSNSAGQKEAHIKITVTPEEFIFAHKGRPFTHDSFSSLVKQVSAQEKENEESVGQYGTGFLTTHSFGRRILVNGSLDLEGHAPGKYVDIDMFEIDRVFDKIDDFVEKMALQLLKIDAFAEAPMTEACREWTELHYQLSSADNAAEKVRKGIDAAIKVMPYVMTVNDPIGDVEIVDNTTGRIIKFSKESLPDENGLKVAGIRICRNGIPTLKKIFYLRSADGNDTVILPLKDSKTAESLHGIAKLFVFFPLLGTEDFGMDVVFHSKRFYPVEERDALHLPVENANVKAKYEANVAVLNQMSEMVFLYFNEHALEISEWVNVAQLSFECFRNKEDITNRFFEDFKAKWVAFFEKLPIVNINGYRQSIASGFVNLYSEDMLVSLEEKSSEWENALYEAVKIYGNVPEQALIKAWSRVAASWYSADRNCFLNFGKLSERLQNTGTNTDVLLNFDRFISAIGLTHLFETYSLIPNRDGVLKRKSELRNADTIPGWLCELVRPIIPNEVVKFVDPRFSGIETLPTYARDELKTQLNAALINVAKDTIRKPIPTVCDKAHLIHLANICLLTPNVYADTIRTKCMRVICSYLNVEYSLKELAPLSSDERDLTELPFQYLIENLLLEISQKNSDWVRENMKYVHSLHECLSSWTQYYSRDSKDGYAKKYGAYPNTLLNPSMAGELKKGVKIPDELIDFYQAIIGKNLKESLIHDDFSCFCEFEEINAADVAKEIQDRLEEDDFKNNAILDIIDLIDKNPEWGKWFARIAEKKAEIFLKQVKPQCKDSVYRLMKVEDPAKLEQLADLADECDIDEILRLGKKAIIERKNEEADFGYKMKLGTYVERFIEKELFSQLNNAVSGNNIRIKVVNDQYGHDLVVKANDIPAYYIEVKSRWGAQQSVEMTQCQLHSCVENADNYALCCVNMVGVDRSDVDLHEYPEVEETIHRIKSLPNIGKLAEGIDRITQREENQVHIGGAYSCVVPQKVISEQGVDFHRLLSIILDTIKAKVATF